jgi:hypothetical protein
MSVQRAPIRRAFDVRAKVTPPKPVVVPEKRRRRRPEEPASPLRIIEVTNTGYVLIGEPLWEGSLDVPWLATDFRGLSTNGLMFIAVHNKCLDEIPAVPTISGATIENVSELVTIPFAKERFDDDLLDFVEVARITVFQADLMEVSDSLITADFGAQEQDFFTVSVVFVYTYHGVNQTDAEREELDEPDPDSHVAALLAADASPPSLTLAFFADYSPITYEVIQLYEPDAPLIVVPQHVPAGDLPEDPLPIHWIQPYWHNALLETPGVTGSSGGQVAIVALEVTKAP